MSLAWLPLSPAKEVAVSLLHGWARWGFAARGIIQIVIGGLGLAAALDARGERPADGNGALARILTQPWLGSLLVGLIAVGLVGHAVWRLVEAFSDRESPRGWRALYRVAAVVSALTHGGLALIAARLLWRGWVESGEELTQETTAELLVLPYGPWLVAVLGVATLGVGLTVAGRGVCAHLTRDLTTRGAAETGASSLARYGHLAQGLVLAIVGGFFLRAAWYGRPSDATSAKGALELLEAQPLGPWLLGVVAAGLCAFGLYGLVEALFRRLPDPTAAAGERGQSAACSWTGSWTR